jgi:hypothetical protein
MDPDANLASQKRLVKKIYASVNRGTKINPEDAEELAVLVEALDEWLARGSFLPTRWSRARPLSTYSLGGRR